VCGGRKRDCHKRCLLEGQGDFSCRLCSLCLQRNVILLHTDHAGKPGNLHSESGRHGWSGFSCSESMGSLAVCLCSEAASGSR
jgi:hypothetical protein